MAAPAEGQRGGLDRFFRFVFPAAYVVAVFIVFGLDFTGSSAPSTSSFIPGVAHALSVDELWSLREDAREMFYHGYDAYMKHGYPWDEIKPLSCTGRRWDKRERGTLDDSLGGAWRVAFRPAMCVE